MRNNITSDHWLRGAILCLLLLVITSPGIASQAAEPPEWLPGLLEKEEITIVVTDSGLGGLSVVADAAEKFRQHAVFRKVNLVFANALFSSDAGYNALQTREEKLKVFSNALQGMQQRYAPDIILVACNTLSVLAPDTGFARTSPVPVVGIIEDGVEQISGQLQGNPAARNIIFATQTTVDEGTHKDQLLALGIGPDQLVTQSCPQLSLYIEQGYDNMYTEMLIDAYVDEALSNMGGIDGPLSVSFNCTHFGYSLELWQRAFASRGIEVAAYLDPNTKMIDFLLPGDLQRRFEQAEITVRVVSMVDIPADRQQSIGGFLQTVSPATADALGNFELRTDLFEWTSAASGPVE